MGFDDIKSRYAAEESARAEREAKVAAEASNRFSRFHEEVPRIVKTIIIPVLEDAKSVAAAWHRSCEVIGTAMLQEPQYRGPKKINNESVHASFGMGLVTPPNATTFRSAGYVHVAESYNDYGFIIYVNDLRPGSDDFIKIATISLDVLTSKDAEVATKAFEDVMEKALNYLRTYGRQ